MLYHRYALVTFVTLSLCGLPALATELRFARASLRDESGRYLQRDASAILLGSYGSMGTPLFAPDYLKVHERVPQSVSGVEIHSSGPIDVDWSKVPDAAISSVACKGLDEGYESLSASEVRRRNPKLVRLWVDAAALDELLDQDARAYLEARGSRARIATSVYVVMDGELASRFTAGTVVAAVDDAGALTVRVGELDVRLPPPFAYGLSKPMRLGASE